MRNDDEHRMWPRWCGTLATVALVATVLGLGVLGGSGDPSTPTIVVLGVVATMIAFSSSGGALVAWVLVLFLRPTDFFPDLAEYRPALRLGALTGFLLLAGKLTRREFTFVSSRHNIWIVLLAVAVLISALNSHDQYASMFEFKVKFVKVVLFWFVALNVLSTRQRAVAFQVALGLAVVVLGGWAVYFKLGGAPVPTVDDTLAMSGMLTDAALDMLEEASGEAERTFLVKGLLEDPNDLALAQLMATPFLIEAWLEARGPRKWFMFFVMLIPVAGIVTTLSRGGLLGLGAGAFVIARGRGLGRVLSVGIVGVFLLAAALSSGIAERTGGGRADSGIDMSAQGRLDAWRSGLNMLRHRPLTGVGYEMFNDYYMEYAIDPAEWAPGKSAHNAFVKCAAEAGMLGFIPFMMLFLRSLLVKDRLRKRGPPPDAGPLERAVVRAHVANLAAVGTSAFFLSVTWHYYLYILFVQSAVGEVLYLRSDRDTAADAEEEDAADVGLEGPALADA